MAETELVEAESVPARTRGRYPPKSALAAAVDQLERDLGGRQALIDTIVGLPESAGLDYVIGLFADPRSDCRSLSALCQAGGVSVGEILEAMKRGLLIKPTLRAMQTIAAGMPPVVEDVMRRAAPHTVPCSTHTGDACTTCQGTGVVTVLPDLDRQKVALDLGRLLPKSGPAVQTLIDNRQQTAIGSVSDLIRLTDAVALRPPAASPQAPRLTAGEELPE